MAVVQITLDTDQEVDRAILDVVANSVNGRVRTIPPPEMSPAPNLHEPHTLPEPVPEPTPEEDEKPKKKKRGRPKKQKKEEPTPEPAEKITLEDLRTKARSFLSQHGAPPMEKLLQEFEVAKVSDLPEEKWVDFIGKMIDYDG